MTLKKKRKKASQDAAKAAEFFQYQNLARSLAGKFSRQYHKPYEEMVDVAEYALSLELWGRRGFDRHKRTKKSTWLYTVIYFHLTQVCTRGIHPCPRYENSLQVTVRQWTPEIPFSCVAEDEQQKFLDPPQQRPMIERLLSDVSDDAKILIAIILTAPEELADLMAPRTIRHARQAVKDYMIDVMDWTTPRVNKVWEEITTVLDQGVSE